MRLKNTIRYNEFKFKKEQSKFKQQRNKAVSLRSFVLFRSAVPVGWKKPPFHSSLVSLAPASPEKGQAVTTLPRPHLHTLTSCVRRGYCVRNTASLRSAALHFIQPYLRPPPLVFWRLLYRQPSTSIGTLTLILIIYSAEASLVRLPLHAPIPTPPKKGLSV